MSTIRAFIAIQLPSNVRNALSMVKEDLDAQLPHGSVRWVKPQLIHLTLRFLGDTAVTTLPSLFRVLDESAGQHEPFILSLGRLGCFPNCKRPRIIWTGLQGQIEAAGALKKDIDSVLVPLGWEQEKRPFRAHLTLGRVKDSRKMHDTHWQATIEKLTLPVTAIHLIESELTPSGPIYTVRHTSQLRGS